MSRYYDEKDIIAEYEKQLQKKDNEIERLNNIINEAIEYIKDYCTTSEAWEDLGFCQFVPIGKIKYKALSSKKVKDLLDILKGVDKE